MARAAAWHRLAPLVHRHLSGRVDPPPAVGRALRQAYVDNAARNLFVAASLQRVVETLAAASIPAMLLKGAALLECCYPDPALRELTDLDILVEPDQLDAANQALAAVGYARALPATSVEDTAPWMREHHMHDPPIVTSDRIVAVELHHDITIGRERARFDIGGLWERARPGREGTHQLPSPEDLLLHVCLHFMRARSERSRGALAQICDIAMIVRGEPIDWSRLVATARTYGLDVTVFLALFAARELGVPIPAAAMDRLCPRGFDPRVGRHLVELRVLRSSDGFPVRSLRWMLAPPRQAVQRWTAHPQAGPRPSAAALALAYGRRATAQLPQLRAAAREPRALLRNHRLNGQIGLLERRERMDPNRRDQ